MRGIAMSLISRIGKNETTTERKGKNMITMKSNIKHGLFLAYKRDRAYRVCNSRFLADVPFGDEATHKHTFVQSVRQTYLVYMNPPPIR